MVYSIIILVILGLVISGYIYFKNNILRATTLKQRQDYINKKQEFDKINKELDAGIKNAKEKWEKRKNEFTKKYTNNNNRN